MANWTISETQKKTTTDAKSGAVKGASVSSTPTKQSRGESHRRAIDERKQARVLALQALFEIDSVGHAPDVVLYERLEAAVRAERARRLVELSGGAPMHMLDAEVMHLNDEGDEAVPTLGEAGRDFLLWLVAGTLTQREQADELIQRFAPQWPIEQLAIVDRNILRMSIFELGASDSGTPPKAVINEAVELAKAYGGDNSPGFVNGVLGAWLSAAKKEKAGSKASRNGESGNGESGNGESGNGESGNDESGNGESGNSESSSGAARDESTPAT